MNTRGEFYKQAGLDEDLIVSIFLATTVLYCPTITPSEITAKFCADMLPDLNEYDAQYHIITAVVADAIAFIKRKENV